MKQSDLNFKYPPLGSRIKILPKGFNRSKVGIFIKKNEAGLIVLNMDPLNLLPNDYPNKIETIEMTEEFEVI